jgi:hypothetical protein
LVGFSFEGGGMRGNGLEYGESGRRVKGLGSWLIMWRETRGELEFECREERGRSQAVWNSLVSAFLPEVEARHLTRSGNLHTKIGDKIVSSSILVIISSSTALVLSPLFLKIPSS